MSASATPSCTGPCNQGDLKCKTPLACQLPETDGSGDPYEGAGAIVTPVVVLALIAVISLIVSVMP
jgi:hypothetical protein